jgi:WhiB family redox-sensing transcriptional regulator
VAEPTDDRSWVAFAACRGATALFYPRQGDSVAEAKAVCDGCPVQPPCLAAAMEANKKIGIWGGASERERRVLRRLRRSRVPCDPDGTIRSVGQYDDTVSVREFKLNMSGYLLRAHLGETILVTRAGRADAVLGPVREGSHDDGE